MATPTNNNALPRIATATEASRILAEDSNKIMQGVSDSFGGLQKTLQELAEGIKTQQKLGGLNDGEKSSGGLFGGLFRRRGGDAGGDAKATEEKTSILSGIVAGIGGFVGALLSPLTLIKKMFGSILRLVGKAGPIGLLIGGAIAIFNDITENENFKSTMESLNNAWSRITDTFSSIKEKFTTGEGLSEGMKTTVGFLIDAFSKIKTFFQDFLLGSVEVLANTVAAVLEGFDILLSEGFVGGFSTIWENIKTAIVPLLASLKDGVIEYFNKWLGPESYLFTSISTFIYNLWTGMKTKFGEAIDAISATWTSMKESVSTAITTTIDVVKTTITDLWNGITTTISTMWTNLTTSVTTAVTSAITFIKDMFAWGGNLVTEGWTNLTTYVSETWTSVKTWFTGLLSWASETIVGAWTSLTDFVSGKWIRVKAWFTNLLMFTSTAITDAWSGLTEFVQEKWTAVKEWFTGLLSWASDTAAEGWTNLTDFVSGVWTNVKTWFTDKLTWVANTAEEGGNFISNLVKDAWQSVKDWFMDSLSNVKEKLPTIEDIKGALIATLPSWMVPDAYKTSAMIAEETRSQINDLEKAIADNSFRSVGFSSEDEKQELAMLRTKLLELEQEQERQKGNQGTVIVNNTTAASGGNSSAQNANIYLGGKMGEFGLRPDVPGGF
jgi:phage-related protein